MTTNNVPTNNDGRAALPMAWVRFAVLPIGRLDGCRTTGSMWADERVRDAVWLASPILARALDHRRDSEAVEAVEDEHLHRSLRSYFSRMASRATPFGLMAGVFSAALTARTVSVELDLSLRVHLRSEDIARPATLEPGTSLQANGGLEAVGDGFLVPPYGSLRCRRDDLGHVRGTPTMRYVVAMLTKPMPTGEAVEHLIMVAGSDKASWLAYLGRLERMNVLVRTSVIGCRPWLTASVVTDPGEQLAIRVGDGPLAHHGDSSYRVSVDAFGQLADGAEIPAEVGDHAVRLLDALDTAAPPTSYPTHLAIMATSFTRRFGSEAEVPLLDAFSAMRGIDIAEAAEQTRRTERDEMLGALIEMAGDDGMIDDPAGMHIRRLGPGHRDGPPRAPAQEICVRASVGPEGIRSELRFVGPATDLGGRFTHLLPASARERLREQIDATDLLHDPYEVVELIVTPMLRGGIMPGVIPIEPLRRRQMSVAAGVQLPGTEATGPQDVLVGVAAGRFYLRSRRSGRLLHVVTSCMTLTRYLSPLEAFLLHVCRTQFRYATPIDWGRHSGAEFLPGIRVGPVYLCAPRWLLRATATGSDEPAVRSWLAAKGVPDRYVARKAGSDRGLLLRIGADDDLLLRMLRRSPSGEVEITTAPDALGPSIIRDTSGDPHIAEIVVTVGTTEPTGKTVFRNAAEPVPVTKAHGPAAPTASDPNTARAAFELTLPRAALTPFLTDRLAPRLVQTDGEAIWWEVEQGSLLRICVPDESVAEDFWRWCRRLRGDGELTGLAQVEYHFHAGRFDGSRTLRLAHEFLAADSRLTLESVKLPGGSARFAVAAAAHVHRLMNLTGLPSAPVRDLMKARENGVSGTLHRRIGTTLYATARAPDQAPLRWAELLRNLIAQPTIDAGHTASWLVEMSLDRMCVSDVLRPHIYGSVRRLIDREIHETRGGARGAA